MLGHRSWFDNSQADCVLRRSPSEDRFARVLLARAFTQSIVRLTALKMAPISFAKRWVKPEVRSRLAFSLYVAAFRRRLFSSARWSVLGFGSFMCVLIFRSRCRSWNFFSICGVFRENSDLVSFAPFLSRWSRETDFSGDVSDVHVVSQFWNLCSMS